MLLVSRGAVATLLISPSPFTDADRAIVERVAGGEAFTIQVSPWTGGATSQLDRIARSRTPDDLAAATADPRLDFSPPTDDRPFFFNMLKPASFAQAQSLPSEGVARGNLYATTTLVVLFGITATLVCVTIVGPLVAHGRPPMRARAFAASLIYFAGIGLGFMLVQMALLQRFSIYLGHPTHTLSITLFSMILFAGIGSYISDRVAPRWPATRVDDAAGRDGGPAGAPGARAGRDACDDRLRPGHAQRDRGRRSSGRLSALLGFFFPTGLRLVNRLSPEATAWMWGVNGAFSVLGSIVAVAISIFVGIHANVLAAAALYGMLAFPLAVLRRESRA